MRENNSVTYTVQKGDTLYKIANQFHTTPESLMRENHLTNTLLTIGQVLVISEKIEPFVPIYIDYNQFMQMNQGYGMLKIHVYTAGGLYPLKDAKVQVSKIIGDTKSIFFTGITEESGIIDNIELPVIPITDHNIPTSTSYQIEVYHQNYKQLYPQNTSVYQGIKSIQGIEMMPIQIHNKKVQNG